MICTIAVIEPAVAVRVPVPLPSGGVYVTWKPVIVEIVPPVTVHVTSVPVARSVLASTAEKAVGPEICTVPDIPDGSMVKEGVGLDVVQPPSDAARAQAATIIRRIDVSQANEVKSSVVALFLYQRNASLWGSASGNAEDSLETCS
jgi:hypothetical protein